MSLAGVEVMSSLPFTIGIGSIHNPLKLFPGEIVGRDSLLLDTFHSCGGVLFQPVVGDTEIEETNNALVLAPGRVRTVAPRRPEFCQFGCGQLGEQR